jgi:hypothetical protein
VTVLYRIVVEVIHVTLIVLLAADDVSPKAPRPNASVLPSAGAALKAGGGMRFAFPPYDLSPLKAKYLPVITESFFYRALKSLGS